MNTPEPGPAAAAAGFNDSDYHWFQSKIVGLTGIRLADYKPDQMRRRLMNAAGRAGCASYAAYFWAMQRDAALLSGFLDQFTINVTELLRNPQRWDELARVVLPDLFARRGPASALSIWSAGCSYGAEAYSVALLLHEACAAGAPPPHRVRGTDIDLAILARANSPCFSSQDMVNVSPVRRKAHFSEVGGNFLPAAHLKARVQFNKHDLLADPYPRAAYDLILCRNVIIYFTDPAKTRIYQNFFQALKPGGVLFVGGTERLGDHRTLGFDLFLPSFYRKPA